MSEVSQQDLFKKLSKSEVKLSGDKAKETKENILKATERAQWLGLGVHEVFIKTVELAEAKTGTLGIKITVDSEDGQSDATFWLSEAALPYTAENISRLVVHNTVADKKDAARTHMSNLVSPQEIFKVAKDKLEGGVAILVVKESKTQTYVNKNGDTVPSIERNLQTWKPKETDQAKVEKTMGKTETSDIDLSELPF